MPTAIIETVTGLFFVFMLMSVVSSQIVEWIASWKRWRARDLEKTLRSMLNDPGVREKVNAEALVLTDLLYDHPLIASLAPAGSKPSYIPADKFTLALFDVILTAGTDTSSIGRARLGLEQVKNYLLASLPASAGADLFAIITQIQALIDNARASGYNDDAIASFALPAQLNTQLKTFLETYKISPQVFNALIQSLTTNGDLQLAQIRSAVMQLASQKPELTQLITSLFTSLDTYISNGESQLAAARQNVEQWFDDSMERAGGWYKQNIQLCLGIIGLVLALVLNVDAVSIATAFWRDPTLRDSVIQQVQKVQLTTTTIATPDQAAQAIRDLNTRLGQDLGLPIGWKLAPALLNTGETCSLLPMHSGEVWGLPVTGSCMQLADAYPGLNTSPPGKILGFLIIAVAISQGAPFWFDLLSKLVNMRISGAVPQKSSAAQGQG